MDKPIPQLSMEDLEQLGDKMAGLLEGHHPDMQGMALAHTVVAWLGTQPPEVRKQAYERLVRTVLATFADLAKEYLARHAH